MVLILCILLALMILKKLRPRAYSKRRASVAFTDASHIESKGKSQMDEPKLQTMKFCNKAFVEDTD